MSVYQIRVADAGEQRLVKNAERLDLYISYQVKNSHTEWNWVLNNTDWQRGEVVKVYGSV